MNQLHKIAGGIGCDLVTGTSEFTARKGKIYAIISNEDASEIASMKYTCPERKVQITVTGLSYQDVAINNNKQVFPDFPLDSITLGAGSFWVFYIP